MPADLLNVLLQRRLRQEIGADRFGGPGQLLDWRMGLVEGIDPAGLTGRLAVLCLRLNRPERASAVVLNSFLPWLGSSEALRIAGSTGFKELFFGTRCPTGIRGTPPVVDMLASGPEGTVAVTARVFDYLSVRQSVVSASYRSLEVPAAMQAWLTLLWDDATFVHVDAAYLAKLAIGLAKNFQHRQLALHYLFLEPQDCGMGAFAAHRAELAWSAARVADSAVPFSACSLHELWQGWCIEDTPPGVRAIAADLARRYGVVMPRSAPL